MRYRVIQEHDRRYPIRLMCRALAVSAAGYYAWRSRPESARSIQTRTLLSAIRVIHQESRETYGSPRIWDALVKQGHRVGEHRVARLMRHGSIRAKTVTKGRATTPSQHQLPVAANILDRAFTVGVPNRVWAADLTYVWTLEGWRYLAVLLDLYSRRVVGWAMGQRLTVELVEQALTMALVNRIPTAGLVHHSDRGSQYAATSYQRRLTEYGLLSSMSRKGNCWETPASKVSSGRSSVSSCTIGTTPHEPKPRRTSSNTLRCSTIKNVGTQPSVITPRPSMKRGWLSRNPVSTKLGEDHFVL